MDSSPTDFPVLDTFFDEDDEHDNPSMDCTISDSPQFEILLDEDDDPDAFDLDDFPFEASEAQFEHFEDDFGPHILSSSQTSEGAEDQDMEFEEQLSSEGSECGSEMSTDSTLSESEAVNKIEEMVLSFLTQLAYPGGRGTGDDYSDQSEEPEEAPSRSDYKIEVQLADRRKEGTDE